VYRLSGGDLDIGMQFSCAMTFVPTGLIVVGDGLAIMAMVGKNPAVWYAAGGLIVGVGLWLLLLAVTLVAWAVA
jgi:hypothetical protein